MNEKKIRNFKRFNRIMVYGILWLLAAALAYIAGNNIICAIQNYRGKEFGFYVEILMQLVLLASAVLLVKAAIDLKNLKLRGAREILIAGLMATVIFIIELLAVDVLGGYEEIDFFYPLFSFCWSVGVFRYYMMFRDQLTE